MVRVLMVCLGNICRSPLAEGILKSKVDRFKVLVESAGTGAYHVGKLPDSRSIAVAKSHNLDITDQRARKFVVNDFDAFDFIYVMDSSNYANVLKLARNTSDVAKVRFILNEVFPDENMDVPDPYYGGEYGFKNVYRMLDEACDVIAKKLT